MEKKELEIEKTLVVSTGHMTEQDDKLLYHEKNILNHRDECWVVIHLGSTQDCTLEEYSSSFREMIAFASSHEEGFQYLKLDADGPILEGFPTYDW